MARFSFLLLATALLAQKAMASPQRIHRPCTQVRFIANPQPPESGCPDEYVALPFWIRLALTKYQRSYVEV
jgi:hypothetical protein